MSSSLIKFANRTKHRGKKLHWGRVREDGLPWRGAFAPPYTQEEFEHRAVRVADPRAEIFDLSNPRDKEAYLEVMDGIANGWYQCVYRERRFDPDDPKRAYVHIEWLEYFMEDGHPTPYMTPGMAEPGNGNGLLLPHGAG